jgi:hypothetical protein
MVHIDLVQKILLLWVEIGGGVAVGSFGVVGMAKADER